ncbi:MAG: DNA topoisomerase 3 [Puniceicoccales bacterium]|jgi:DNA topoisomerase-3|nr:DNA topoisomerase 3 [Puniceicoccales bacterium]
MAKKKVNGGAGQTLVIAEKPSVARDIAKVLGATRKNGDSLESDSHVVTSALGHLVELCMPEDLSPTLRRWSLATLPILPDRFLLKVSEATKDRFAHLCQLLNSDAIGEVINACDAGREGELIFSYVYELSGSTKPFRRLWLVSMTAKGIEDALQHLRPAEEMAPLQAAARCRSEADWLVGINGTRAITVRRMVGNSVASVGRVQTPTLALVVAQDRAIRSFQPVSYWRVIGKFSLKSGTYEGVHRPADGDGDGRIWDEEVARRVRDETSGEMRGTVVDRRKRSRQSPPRLYDLTTLQREANNRFGLSPLATLQIAQRLYEVHKCITYPRTDAKALPEDYGPVCRETIKGLAQDYGPLAEDILAIHGIGVENRKIFNNKDISDHFAIIPTPQRPGELKDFEAKIYAMVVRRFLAAFYPPAEYDVVVRTTTVAGHAFHSESRELAVPGWLAVYERDRPGDENLLPSVGPDDGQPPTAAVVEVQLLAERTRPPAPYTEATLLSAMETAGKLVADEELAEAMKEKGLGTPATRAQIIENLITTRYLQREDRHLRATDKAEQLVDCLDAMGVDALRNPAMTGEWEWKLRKIEKRQLDRPTFMAEIAALTKSMVERICSYDELATGNTRPSAICSPLDGQPLLETLRGYVTADRTITIPHSYLGHRMSADEVVALLRDGHTAQIDDFRSRAGKLFCASLALQNGHVRLVFADNGAERARQELAGSTADDVLGTCRRCGGKVLWTEQAVLCENQADESCPFRLGRRMLGHEFSRPEVEALLASGRSQLIEDFISNRTGRRFGAYLLLDGNGKISFEFPPRPPKADRQKRKTRKRNDDAATPAPVTP